MKRLVFGVRSLGCAWVAALTFGAALSAGCGPGGAMSAGDAASDAASDAALTGEVGGAPSTALRVAFGANTRTLDRAQFGLEGAAMPDGTRGYYVEAHLGGDAACPTMGSPTPRYTLVLSGLRFPSARGELTMADGVSASVLDFQGDLLPTPAPARATSVTVRQVAPASESTVVLNVSAQFAGGTLEGSLVATRCTSLDE